MDPNFVKGTQIVSVDNFNAENEFHGCDIGLRAEFCCHDFTFGVLAKVAGGIVNHEMNIEGSQTTTVPGVAPVVQNGGVLALSSNTGKHPSYDWAILPELGANLSWQVNRNMRLHGGYSILLLDQVVRPAEHVDQTLNPNLFPPPVLPLVGPNRPTFKQDLSEIWLQSVFFGVEITF